MTGSRVALYFRGLRETDRWIPGDRYVRPIVRRVLRGTPRVGGVGQVFVSLCKGLDELAVKYDVNPRFSTLRAGDRIAVLGRTRDILQGYTHPFPIVAGIGMMTHPSEWPTLCDEYPVVTYLSHSEWVNRQYVPYFGERCALWPVGIDTTEWQPAPVVNKSLDFIVYDKIPRIDDVPFDALLATTRSALMQRGLSFETVRYGQYEAEGFRNTLARARGLIFLSPHESQGIACGETLASGVPVLAWDPGRWTDPNRLAFGEPDAEATSVPYFDDRCGVRFQSREEFSAALDVFIARRDAGVFRPREYILEKLTLAGSARKFLDYLDEAQTPAAQSRISPRLRAGHGE